jgi:hypothetical protein
MKIAKIAFLSYGALGDCAYSSPICHRLRTLYPDAEITWIIFDLYRDFVANNPDIDSYIAWPLVPGQTRQQQEVQRWKEMQEYAYTNFDLVVRAQCWPWDNIPQACLWNEQDDRTIFDHQLHIANTCEPKIGLLDKTNDRRMIFEYSRNDTLRAPMFLEKNKLMNKDYIGTTESGVVCYGEWKIKPFICITPFANTVGNALTLDDYKILSEKYPVVYFGGTNNQEIPWAIDGRGTTFGEMVAIAEKSIGAIILESGPGYLISTRMNTPIIVMRNPYSFPLHKQGLVKCGFRTEKIKELVVTNECDKKKLFEEAIEFMERQNNHV